MEKQKYYTTTNIDRTGAIYRIIIGERSNGKTTSVLLGSLLEFINSGYTNSSAYIRRYREDTREFGNVCTNLVALKWVEKYTKGKYNAIRYYRREWKLAKINDKGELIEMCPNSFMYGFCLSESDRIKSTSYPRITRIIFDEFLSRDLYLKDEFILFQSVISTIVRERDNVVIYMLGNTVNKYCPYFEEMGLYNIKKQKRDTIDIYEMGKNGTTKVAVEYCDTIRKKSDIYFAFNNPRLTMITEGSWEIDIYPHLPLKYERKHKIFSYYMDFKGELLECEVISLDDNLFTYIHRKTTPIVEEIYPVYSTKFNAKINYSNSIFNPRNKVEKFILSFFTDNKVCYQTNEIGELVRNFLNIMKK